MRRLGSAKKPERRGRSFLCGLVLILAMTGSRNLVRAQVASRFVGRHGAKVNLRVYNYAVSGALLSRSESEATAVFNKAGVDVAWVDCPLALAELANYTTCQAQMGATDFALKIMTAEQAERLSFPREAMGEALDCSAGDIGCSAYVFYRHVAELAKKGHASEYQLLGRALAHEIGHLLLGPNSHSRTGIMRSRWSHTEVKRITRAQLLFTDQQAQLLRDEVSARDAIQHHQLEELTDVNHGRLEMWASVRPR